jgi:hypothetical protein
MNPIEQTTIDKIRNLSPDLQQQILTFVEFLEFKAKSQPKPAATSNKRQGFGLWKGDITIHADFDEPLADFEDYM